MPVVMLHEMKYTNLVRFRFKNPVARRGGMRCRQCLALLLCLLLALTLLRLALLLLRLVLGLLLLAHVENGKIKDAYMAFAGD